MISLSLLINSLSQYVVEYALTPRTLIHQKINPDWVGVPLVCVPVWHGGFRSTPPELVITIGTPMVFDAILCHPVTGGAFVLDDGDYSSVTSMDVVGESGAKYLTIPMSGGDLYSDALYAAALAHTGPLPIRLVIRVPGHPNRSTRDIGTYHITDCILILDVTMVIFEDTTDTHNICFGRDDLTATTRPCRPSANLIGSPIWSVFATGPTLVLSDLESKVAEAYPSARQSGHDSVLVGYARTVNSHDANRYGGNERIGMYWPPITVRSDRWDSTSASMSASYYDWALSYRGLYSLPVNRTEDVAHGEWTDLANGALPLSPSDIRPDPFYEWLYVPPWLEWYPEPRYVSASDLRVIPATDDSILLFKSSFIPSGKVTLALHTLDYTYPTGQTHYMASATRGEKLDEVVIFGTGMTRHPADDTWYDVPLPSAMHTAWFMEKAESNISPTV